MVKETDQTAIGEDWKSGEQAAREDFWGEDSETGTGEFKEEASEQEQVDSLARTHAENLKDPRYQRLKRWMQLIICELQVKPHVGIACLKGKVSRETAYNYRDNNLDFRGLWDEAVESHTDTAEYSLYDLGTKGDVKEVYKDGQLVSKEHRRDSQALRFFLSGNRPQKYRENSAPQVTVNVLNWSNGGAELPQPVEDKREVIEMSSEDCELLGE
jgi:hypothetical protein